MDHRSLGSSSLQVSALSLGSWRTFERIPREVGVEVMRAARAEGITFLDDARYDDEAGSAPIPTGYSEIVFGELFRAAGWSRDAVVVANKLWWEFWPEQSAAEELAASLARMRFDRLDLLYSAAPPAGLTVTEVAQAMDDLIASGRVAAWGVLNWSAAQLAEVRSACASGALVPPCAAQLPYNLLYRGVVEDQEVAAELAAGDIGVVASAVLAGGALSGKYAAGGVTTGRLARKLDKPDLRPALDAAEQLLLLAAEIDAPASALALAFALANPLTASVLFGATTPSQVRDNARAVELLTTLDDAQLARLRAIQ